MIPPRYIVLQKKRGETPLEALQVWKAGNREWRDFPASYAGRLDPMAEGKLLILLGDECKEQERYTKLDKEYEVELVLDLKTDTGDALGLAEYVGKETRPTHETILAALSRELGTHSRAYPVFSSKTVNGKPLFLYQLEGKSDEIEIPVHKETIYRIELLDSEECSRKDLEDQLKESLSIVPRSDEPSKLLGADFRQDAIRARWRDVFRKMPDRKFTRLRLRVTCGSGAYMRTLAERIGTSLGTHAVALSINRTKIGKYLALGGLGLWSKDYR